ncbi:hypothetical protein ODQ97_03925 [Escherichia coli]|nr:hypothetical protein [Escherichia coli]
MEKTENKPILVGVASIPFKFELSQLVEVRISDEWGEVKARAQYADGENQYLIHYKAADGRATTVSGLVSQCWKQQKMIVILVVRYLPS